MTDAAVPLLNRTREERGRFRWILLAALVVALLASVYVSSQTLWAMRDHGHDWWRLFSWQAACWGFWAAVAPLAVRQGRRLVRPDRRPALWPLRLAAWGGLLTAVNVLWTTAAFWLLQPYEPVATFTFVEGLSRDLEPLARIGPLIYGIEVVVGYGLGGYLEARRAELRRSRLEAELARSQLDALRLEIQPHFLFNSLNSIAAEVRAGADDEALEMLLALSDLLRATLERRDRPEVSLSEELDLLRRYAGLQGARFGDRLTVELRAEEETQDDVVPVFLLQPLVENSIRHGLGRRAGALRVEVEARHEGDRLRIVVRDDGPGLPPGFELDATSGVGLRNTRSRLARLYGSAARLDLVDRERGGVEATVTLPIRRRLSEAVAS